VAEALQAPPRPARVLAAFPTALYLQLDRHELVVPVLAEDALRLPTGLRLALPAREIAWGVEPGSQVSVGGGRVRLPHRDVVVVRAWRPARVTAAAQPLDASALARSIGALHTATDGSVLRELTADLTRSALATSVPAGRLARLAAGLVGAGRGLTPSGDDALCGVLLALRAGGAPSQALAAVSTAVTRSLAATTSLSASLLLAAAAGCAVPEVATLANAVSRGDEAGIDEALPAVLAIGHSSGADLLAGLAGALDALIHTTQHTDPEGARRA
jgi:hypothetical protein